MAVSTIFDRLQFPIVGNNGAGNLPIQNQTGAVSGNVNASRPNRAQSKAFCVRCLLVGHERPACCNKICYRNCKEWGHIPSGCRSAFRALVVSNHLSTSVSVPPAANPVNGAIVVPSPRNAIVVAGNQNPPFTPLPNTPEREAVQPSSSISIPPPPPLTASRLLQSTAVSGELIAQEMPNFPFDPTAFLPPQQQAIQVVGRLARVWIITSPAAPRHEDWAIATVVPMPNQQVFFPNVRQLIGEFITQVKHLAFQEICPCPFG